MWHLELVLSCGYRHLYLLRRYVALLHKNLANAVVVGLHRLVRDQRVFAKKVVDRASDFVGLIMPSKSFVGWMEVFLE